MKDKTTRVCVKNLIDLNTKASQIKMDKDTKIFQLMQTIITFIEEKCGRNLAPRKASYKTLCEDVLSTLKEQQHDEATFKRCHDEVTMLEHTLQT